jgi:hypothetical protein
MRDDLCPILVLPHSLLVYKQCQTPIGGSTASNAATVANRTKGLNWGMQVENESGGDMKTSIV